ncbi:SerB Phosphoserine phosphatase [Candidatus Nanopelagicaceae bacterium]
MTVAKRLVQLDVDSTFIQQEAIELLAAKAGVLEEVSRVTEAAMRGELDFSESLRARVALLKGLPEAAIVEVQNEILLTDGADALVKTLHEKGHCVALVSGGFSDILKPLVESLGIKHYRANKLGIANGLLTGTVEGAIVDRAAKADALKSFAAECNVNLQDTVAIGDGANDLDMMEIAGISIAFNAKPVVVQAADYAINEPSLRSVLDLIGAI